MRVVTLTQSEQRADGERQAPVDRIGGQQLGRPRVIADPVDDRQLRGGHRARVAGARLVVVGILGGVDDDALHAGVNAAQLARDAAPEVLGGRHAYHVAAEAAPGARASGGEDARDQSG